MNIRIIKQQVYEISQMKEELSESLIAVSRFFLVSLSYLQGERVAESYREAFEETCKILQKEEAFYRVAPAWDALLAAVFYYRQAMVCHWWQRERNGLHFSLSLLDCYELLLGLSAEETGEEMVCEVRGGELFEELFLSSKPVTFSKKEVWKELLQMYRYLREKELLAAESHFEYALMRNKRSLFMARFPWMKTVSNWSTALSITLGTFLLIALVRIAYNLCVEFPILRLMSLERAGKVYDRKMVEVLLQCRSFMDNGIQVFGSRVLFFCSAFLIVVGIEYMIEKWNDWMCR